MLRSLLDGVQGVWQPYLANDASKFGGLLTAISFTNLVHSVDSMGMDQKVVPEDEAVLIQK